MVPRRCGCRGNDAAYSFVVNLIIPGTPVLSLVAVFINEHHPDILDGPASTTSAIGHRPASKSSPALIGMQDRQQPCLQRLSSASSSANVLHAGLARASGSSTAGAHSSSNGPAAVGRDERESRYATPVAGRPVDAGSDDSPSVSSSAANAAAGLARGSCDSALQGSPAAGGEEDEEAYQRPRDVNDWQPFDFALHRFLHGGAATRQAMFKLIPHIAEGSWVIKQSVGTVPVILGNKLQTVYYQTDRYIEATVDVTSSSAAAYITGACACSFCCRGVAQLCRRVAHETQHPMMTRVWGLEVIKSLHWMPCSRTLTPRTLVGSICLCLGLYDDDKPNLAVLICLCCLSAFLIHVCCDRHGAWCHQEPGH